MKLCSRLDLSKRSRLRMVLKRLYERRDYNLMEYLETTAHVVVCNVLLYLYRSGSLSSSQYKSLSDCFSVTYNSQLSCYTVRISNYSWETKSVSFDNALLHLTYCINTPDFEFNPVPF